MLTMNYALKLLIPLALGIVAAVVNWMVLSANTQPLVFVTVKTQLAVGDLFDLEMCDELRVPPTFKNLSKSAVRFEDRGVLSGRVVRRAIEPGDPVFFADTDLSGEWLMLDKSEELFPVELDEVAVDQKLLRIGNQIRFRVPAMDGESAPPWVGPFKIVAVGSKINNNFSEERGSSSGGTLSIGIAYNMQRDKDQLTRLEQFCDEQRRGAAQMLGVRIVDTR